MVLVLVLRRIKQQAVFSAGWAGAAYSLDQNGIFCASESTRNSTIHGICGMLSSGIVFLFRQFAFRFYASGLAANEPCPMIPVFIRSFGDTVLLCDPMENKKQELRRLITRSVVRVIPWRRRMRSLEQDPSTQLLPHPHLRFVATIELSKVPC